MDPNQRFVINVITKTVKSMILLLNDLFILMIILLFPCILNAQWADQESGVVADLIDVSFADPLNGCIIGEEATILTTNDGGEHWIKRQSPFEDAVFTKVHIIDKDKGFIIGNDGLLLETYDGGKTWLKNLNSLNYNFSDITFVDAQNGWISCWFENLTSPAQRNGAILHTSDGGMNWEIQLEILGDIHNSTLFMAVEFLNKNNGWALGGNYIRSNSDTFLYRTTDGGNNWEKISTVFATPFYELNIVDENTLWVSKPYHLISQDGGYNWLFYPEQNNYFMMASAPIDNNLGWIYTYDLFEEISKILFTYDGGKNWIVDVNKVEQYVNSMIYIDNGNLWVVGNRGLIKHRQGTPTDIKNENLLASEFELSQNYPNPFNPITKIKYAIAQYTHPSIPSRAMPAGRQEGKERSDRGVSVKLVVYDVLGRKVTTLVNEKQKPGNYEVIFDAVKYPSGVYFYQLKTGDYVNVKKMMLMK